MSTYFIAYPVTPNMGLRDSINAMLSHVADNSHPFGYLPSSIHQANYEGILEDYDTIVQSSATDSLELIDRVEDSATLAYLAETLETLCNDYPAYDEERMYQIEHVRVIEMLEETREEDHPSAEDIARALYQIGAYIEQSEYGANVSEDDYVAAIECFRREESKELARANGQTEPF